MPDKKKTENDVLVKLTNLKQTGGLLRFVSQATKSGFVPIKVLQGVLDVFFFLTLCDTSKGGLLRTRKCQTKSGFVTERMLRQSILVAYHQGNVRNCQTSLL